MSSNHNFDYGQWLLENPPITSTSWYDELSDPDLESRQSRPVDIRRMKILALRNVEKSDQNSDDAVQQETAYEVNSDDDFDINNEDDAEDNTVYGGLHEQYNPQAYSAFSKNFMSKLGYDVESPDLFSKNPGLGKENNGISTPIQGDLSRWGTTAGLGSITAMKQVKHVYKKPNIELKIPVVWIPRLDEEEIIMPPNADIEDFSLNEDTQFNSPSTWCGLRVKTISYTDTTYCPLDVQLELFSTKSEFDDVGNDIFLDARNRSNPYELLKREYFQNRAALKMAELDAECGHIFTNPPCYQVQNDRYPSPFYWGDVCAGPGGFSEFISTVVKWKGKGFGFTLKAENDFQLEKFNQCSTPQTFQAFYGDGTGDVTRAANLISYSNEVYQGTGGTMLHVMMADGGFSVAGKENYQELLSRQLLLCQCAAALLTLRKGGVCVIKMFDNFLRFTIDCIYLMRLAFEDVAIVKPHQSRPANSERYLVCKGLRQQGGVNHPIAAYMLRVNDMMNQLDPLHQQSGLVQSAESKPLLFLSAGILAGAQFDGNRDVDGDGNIIDVSEQQAFKKAQEQKMQLEGDEKDQNNKRNRRVYENNNNNSNIAMNNNDDNYNSNNDDFYYKEGNEGHYDEDYDDNEQNQLFNPDGECFDPILDDPFAIEYIDLPSVYDQGIEQRCYEAQDAMENNTIQPGYNIYGDFIPPEPRIDKELFRQQQQYVSSDIYTDKHKNEEKKKKFMRQQSKYQQQNDPEEDQYTFSMKDIIVTGQTIHSLVPLKHHDKAFKEYVLEWNQSYAVQQIQWLRRVLQYIQDASLPTDDQDRIRVQCLQRWKIVVDLKNESGDGMVHWNPIWGKLWSDPSHLLQSELKSPRLFHDLTSFSQQLIDRMNDLAMQNGIPGGSAIATDTVSTSSIMNQQQIQALLCGGQSMSAFTSITTALQNRNVQDSRRMGGNNYQHAASLLRGDNLFGNNPRFSSQYALYYNFCKFIYYNTHCIDMAYALKLIGLDLQYLPYTIRLADLKNDTNFRYLRSLLTKILTHWFKFINKLRPVLSPPDQPPIQDANVLLETRNTYQTTSTNWCFLPIHAKAKRCLSLTLTPDKRHASFNRTLTSVIFPHHHLTLTSPQGLLAKIGGGLNFSDPNSFKSTINPLLSQILTSNRDSCGGEDQCGDGPYKRFQQQQQQQGVNGQNGPNNGQNGQNVQKSPSSTFYPPAQFSSQELINSSLEGILRSELNVAKEHQFMKQNIQHDSSTGLLKYFPGDMIFDSFINLDVPPPPSAAFLSRQSHLAKQQQHNGKGASLPAQQSLSQIPIPSPRFRTTIYDSWSLPHHTGAKNLERYMYERLPYTDRFQNLKVLSDTLRIKEPPLPLNSNSVNGAFQGQDIKTKKLLYHSRHQLSQLNKNQSQFNGQSSTATLTINQLTTATPNPTQFPSTLEFNRAYDLMDWMKDPFNLWNKKNVTNQYGPNGMVAVPEKSKDNLFMFQKGHKLYSLSIWLALFSYTSHPVEQLAQGINQQVHQRRIDSFNEEGIKQQNPQEIAEIYQLLKLLQQKAICDSIAAVWLPPPPQRPQGQQQPR